MYVARLGDASGAAGLFNADTGLTLIAPSDPLYAQFLKLYPSENPATLVNIGGTMVYQGHLNGAWAVQWSPNSGAIAYVRVAPDPGSAAAGSPGAPTGVPGASVGGVGVLVNGVPTVVDINSAAGQAALAAAPSTPIVPPGAPAPLVVAPLPASVQSAINAGTVSVLAPPVTFLPAVLPPDVSGVDLGAGFAPPAPASTPTTGLPAWAPWAIGGAAVLLLVLGSRRKAS